MPPVTEIQKKRFAETLKLLPKGFREKFESDPGVFRGALKAHKASMSKEYPSVSFVPNIGQEKALRCLAAPNENTGDYPHIVMALGGNGSGKTCVMNAVLLPGICLGPDFVNKTYCNWLFFHKIADIRASRTLYVRIVGESNEMQESGSVFQEINKWIPSAQFRNKEGGFYKTVQIGDVNVDFKTFEQSLLKHSGSNFDIIIFNEPPPEPVYKENMARLRGSGYAFFFLTPLNLAAYLLKVIDTQTKEGELSYSYISKWDACKDIPGNRGHKTRVEIERDISYITDPDEIEAKVYGKFQHLAGSVFKIYDENVHKIDPVPIDRNWNIYQIVDPHLVKPPFAIWVAVDPLGRQFVVAEYPTEPWDTLKSTSLTIGHHGLEFDLIEQGKNSNFPYFKGKPNFLKGDPNLFKTRQPRSATTLQQEYFNDTRRWYDLNVCDDITVGFNAIKSALFFNKNLPVSSTNQPRLYVFNTCKNVSRALRDFGIKQNTNGTTNSDSFDETWGCPIACLRYFEMSVQPWEDLSLKNFDDYSESENVYSGKNVAYMKRMRMAHA